MQCDHSQALYPGPFKRRRVSLCLWLSSCMSFNFIKLENRKYELTPSTSEQGVLQPRHGGEGDDAGAGSSSSSRRKKREALMLREPERRCLRR